MTSSKAKLAHFPNDFHSSVPGLEPFPLVNNSTSTGGSAVPCVDRLFLLILTEVITARKRSLRRLCFYTCLSVHRGEYLDRYNPGQVHPLGPGTPRSRRPLPEQTPSGAVHVGRYGQQAKRAVRFLLECILVFCVKFG